MLLHKEENLNPFFRNAVQCSVSIAIYIRFVSSFVLPDGEYDGWLLNPDWDPANGVDGCDGCRALGTDEPPKSLGDPGVNGLNGLG